MSKKKYYVVWNGKQTGVFDNWNECQKQISGFNGAQFMSFENLQEAEIAFSKTYYDYKGTKGKKTQISTDNIAKYGKPLSEAFAVDAAFNGNEFEYRCVFIASGKEIFHFGPEPGGSNNIGEFLAIVHSMAFQQQKGINIPIYSDSYNAIKWVNQKHTNITVELTNRIKDLLERAEKWLQNNTLKYTLLKWQTEAWGEIPADFGRK